MRRAAFAILGLLGGAILGWAAAMAVYVALTSAGLLFDRDGGLAMGFAFTIGPIAGLIGGVAGAWWAGGRA